MKPLKLKDNKIYPLMDVRGLFHRYKLNPINFQRFIKLKFNINIPDNIILNGIKQTLAFLRSKGLEIQGTRTPKIIRGTLIHAPSYEETVVEKTLPGYPEPVVLFKIIDYSTFKPINLVFIKTFFIIQQTCTSLEDLEGELTKTHFLCEQNHEWIYYADGHIDATDDNDAYTHLFKYPKTDKHNTVLCPICQTKLYYCY